VKAPNPRLFNAALNAIITHLRLMALLRAESPKGLLAAVPPGYMAQRILELAEGTCMGNFSYAGGGDWGGKSWTPELPDDSQLLCYLFCAFLEVPGWVFAVDGAVWPGRYCPPRHRIPFSSIIHETRFQNA